MGILEKENVLEAMGGWWSWEGREAVMSLCNGLGKGVRGDRGQSSECLCEPVVGIF